jgi:signal transduction histidine kinase
VHVKNNQIAIYLCVTVLLTLISFCTDRTNAIECGKKIGTGENIIPLDHDGNTAFAGILSTSGKMQINAQISNPMVYTFIFAFCLTLVSMIYFLVKNKFFSDALNQTRQKLKAKDDKLLRLQQNLEDALSIKTHFLATVSHEIRTPVNGIVGMNQLLLETGLNERQKDYAKTANNCGYKLIETVDAMLEYSSLQAGKILIKEANFDLRSVLDKTIQKAQTSAAKKKIKLEIETSQFLPERLVGDQYCIRQIIQKLLNNSLKFSKHGGTVTFRTALLESNSEYHTIRFEVEDSGPGIPEALRDKIFTPFAQGDESFTREYEGLGLGLAISKSMTSAIGGELSFESNPGKGTRFWLKVNLKNSNEETPPL